VARVGWLLAACVALSADIVQAQGNEPAPAGQTARLTFRGRTAAIGAGFTWGASTLEFQGKSYPVRVDGFVLGSLGTASIEGSGEVTGLTKAEDVNGDYTAVSTGVTLGQGRGKLVMRNDKGVRIVIDATSSGLELGIGPRGFTLAVGEAGGPPADAGARLPQTLGFGEFNLGGLYLRPTLNAQIYQPITTNAGFNGQWSFGPVQDADNWFEHSNEIGLNARIPLKENEWGTLRARASGIFSMTTSLPDGPVCNTHGTVSDYTLESAYVAWQSGGLFPKLGNNAIELSGGNQNYQVFDGFLFWDGGQDCAGRGANWLSARKAFEATGIFRLTTHNLTLEAVHLRYNDRPNSNTSLFGERIEYVTDDWYMKHFKVGFMFFHIYDSKTATRDGMDGYYVYHEATPFPFLPDLSYKATFVEEDNSKSSGLTSAYAWYVAPAYQISQAPWTPTLSYRYAFFSGGPTTAFDSLFTGLPDWGSWFQGEILGEYVLSNSNLVSHQVRLKMVPSETVTANVIYYHFQLVNRNQGFGLTPGPVSSHSLADEVDLIVDLTLTNWWSITGTVAAANPNKAFTQAVGGHSTWVGAYLYMNFNF
jgi:hypothetical protein